MTFFDHICFVVCAVALSIIAAIEGMWVIQAMIYGAL